ncbi:MAG TPA: ribokinase, partial [Actinomycetota bacterium]|nr:ribokinase [Actinomycetota bacterium]
IGAINVDLVVAAERLPAPGETVGGGAFARHHGGKGGNQAVAAARALREDANGKVVLIAAVGNDKDMSGAALDALREEHVETDGVAVIPDVPTGIALIVVDSLGENQIAVAPGANEHLTSAMTVASLERLTPRLVLASLEVPLPTVRAAGEWCKEHGVPFVLNPAPASPEARELLPFATYVTPNERELAALGTVPDSVVVVETRGAKGARIRSGGSVEDVPGLPVEPVDATGAGDCFNGVFAASLLEGRPLRESVERAVVAAGLSVTKPGAREGMPSREEIERAIRDLRDVQPSG